MTDEEGEARISVLMLTLFCAMGIAPLIQFSVGALAPFLVREFDITRTQVGLLTSVIFLTSAAVALRLGVVVDRLTTRTALLALYIAGGAAIGLLASAQSYPWALVAVAIAGAPMALANPATNWLIREHASQRARALLVGFKQAVVQGASAIAGFALPTIAVTHGWRVAVMTLAVAPALGALLAFRLVSAPRPLSGVSAEPIIGARVVRLAVYAGLLGVAQAALPSHLTLYAIEELGYAPQAAGMLLGIMGITGAAARIGWASRAERTATVGWPLLLIAVASTFALLIVAAAARTTGAVLIAGVVLFGATAPVWIVVVMLAILRDVPAGRTGRATGIVYTGFSVGFVIGPALVGWTVDVTGSYQTGWLLCAVSTAVGVMLAVRMVRA